jgi:predicted nucleotidyltransferase
MIRFSVAEVLESLRESIPKRRLRALVLFGSAARGEFGPESDLDLLAMPRTRGDGSQVLAAIRAVEERFPIRIAVLVSHSPKLDDLERQLLESILREGVPLVGKLPAIDVRRLDLQPVRLLALNLRGLNQREKVRLERELFGYRSERRHGRKRYGSQSPGFLQRHGGRRIGRSLAAVPERAVPELERLLEQRGAHRILIPAWLQNP